MKATDGKLKPVTGTPKIPGARAVKKPLPALFSPRVKSTTTGQTPTNGNIQNRILRRLLIVGLYVAVFSSLDWFTRAFQIYPGVVAWYPPDGISFALLLALGEGYAPALILTSLIDSFIIYQTGQPAGALIGWAVILALVYTAAAAFLRRRIHIGPQFRNMRDVLWLVFSAVIVSAILALVSVSALVAGGEVLAAQHFEATLTWWVGEAIGILVVTPVLLIHVMPGVRQFIEGDWDAPPLRISFPRPTMQIVGQAISILGALYLVFGVHALDRFEPLYLLTIPLIWISLAYGLPGISLGIVAINFGTTLAMFVFHLDIAELG